ncbi:hypothetical protein [Sphingomonas sp. M1-B02]|uniref:hypothetical protein n=1 Tax=Sphingomonas sp. M1-B02 TaxID=3114300 RepID=UPI00223F86E4|nr:hypothetical protein [Sphingomonas sp. S6-11]UZK67327.1 hypothetical protein OKW87_05690 [Sphingomonas sp. S6-11]
MPIKRNLKLVSNEQLQEFFDLFESMTTVVEGGISFPSFRAFDNFEEILPDAFTVKPGLRRSAAIRIFRKALYDCRREGPLTADALIARAEEIYRQNRDVRLKEFTLWTKIRIHGIDQTQILKFKWGDVSIRLCGQMPKWLRLAPFHNSNIGAVVPDTPTRSGYIILSCRERKEDDAVDRMLDALNLLMALMNIYQTRGSWTIMSGNTWTAGQLRMGPFQFVFQDRKFLGENRIWYDPNYDEAAWNAPHPGMDKYLQIVPFTRKALSALNSHPLKHVLVPALQISQDAFEASEGNHRLLRFWTALEKIYVEDGARDRSNQKVIDRATFSDADHHLTRWQLGHISRLRNEHVHARGHGDAFMEQSQVLRDLFTRHILHWIFHGRTFDSHEELLAYVDLPRTDKALKRARKLVDRRLALNRNK